MRAHVRPDARLVRRRGLRVRVGMHTGIEDAADAVMNKTTGRMQYGGLPLALAKAVADSGHGGMILLSQVRLAGRWRVCPLRCHPHTN